MPREQRTLDRLLSRGSNEARGHSWRLTGAELRRTLRRAMSAAPVRTDATSTRRPRSRRNCSRLGFSSRAPPDPPDERVGRPPAAATATRTPGTVPTTTGPQGPRENRRVRLTEDAVLYQEWIERELAAREGTCAASLRACAFITRPSGRTPASRTPRRVDRYRHPSERPAHDRPSGFRQRKPGRLPIFASRSVR